MFYSTLPLPAVHKHWDIYFQLCMWDHHHVFLIATLVFTRLLLDEIYHLIELPFDWLVNSCVYQTATRWDLPPYWITIWFIDWWCSVCLFSWWIDSRFLLQRFDIGNQWIWTRIDYHPCFTREPTNQDILLQVPFLHIVSCCRFANVIFLITAKLN